MTDDGPGTFLLYVSRRTGTRAVGRKTAHVRRQFRAITRRKEPEGKSTHSVIHSRQSARQKQVLSSKRQHAGLSFVGVVPGPVEAGVSRRDG